MLALSLEARWVVRALAAPDFFDSYKAVPLVSTGVALYALYLVLSVSVSRTGRTAFNFPVTGAALAVNIALNLMLVPPYGLVGAGIALVGAYVVMIALMYGVTRRIFPLDLEWGRLAAHRRDRGCAVRARRAAAADLRRRRLPARERAWRCPIYRSCRRAASSATEERDAMRRALERARGASAQPSQDLEALRTRADLMDEVHDPQ